MKWTWDDFGCSPNDGESRRASPEALLLGCILLTPTAWNETVGIVSNRDFREERHRLLFQSLARLYANSGEVDVEDVVALLEKSGEFEPLGGAAYLAELVKLRTECRSCSLLRPQGSREFTNVTSHKVACGVEARRLTASVDHQNGSRRRCDGRLSNSR